jgi:phosphoribosyl-AMP cyclohydrolase
MQQGAPRGPGVEFHVQAALHQSLLPFYSWQSATYLIALKVMTILDNLKFNADGLIPAIIQEQATGRVLMMAWMNKEAIQRSLEEGKTVFWSRSRQKYWIKGESSGHVQKIKDIAFDCDGDTLLIQVDQTGAACHEGYKSCFFRSIKEKGRSSVVTEPQLVKPEEVYGKK